MNNIVLLFVCLLLGIALRVTQQFHDHAHLSLNSFIIHISLPALIILQIHSVSLRPEHLLSIAMPWIMFSLGVGFFWMLSARLNFSRETTGALMLSGGLANTSFVGLPMIEAFFNASSLATGILIDQLGTYLVLSTLGVTVATIYSANSDSRAAILKRIIAFPPLLALIAAFAFIPFELPSWISELLKRLSDTLAPLALVSVGLQLRFDQAKGLRSALATSLGFKLLLAPAVLAFVLFRYLRQNGRDYARYPVRGRDGTADRGRDCRNSTWPQPPAGFLDGWRRHLTLVFDLAAVVLCFAPTIDY